MKAADRFDPREVRQEIGKFGKSEGGEAFKGRGEECGEAWEEASMIKEEECDNSDPEILNERLEALVDNMEPSEKEMRDKAAVLDSLRSVLRNKFPEVELIPYGSSESTLAFSGSDLDIFVCLGDEEEVRETKRDSVESLMLAFQGVPGWLF